MHESHNAPEATVTAATEVEGFPGRYARSFYCHILQYALVRCLFSFFYYEVHRYVMFSHSFCCYQSAHTPNQSLYHG